jgi:hypothetical protein
LGYATDPGDVWLKKVHLLPVKGLVRTIGLVSPVFMAA